MVDPLSLLDEVLSGHKDAEKWNDARFEAVKRLANTKVGDVGQDFVERLSREVGFECALPTDKQNKETKHSPWDIDIQGVKFEVKTATEDVSSAFQFNHIRYHREYDAVLCLGIAPSAIYFGVWSKADVATGKAGGLVTMDKGSSATFKLTKKPNDLHQIEDYKDQLEIFFKQSKSDTGS